VPSQTWWIPNFFVLRTQQQREALFKNGMLLRKRGILKIFSEKIRLFLINVRDI
jgi:hypothetical protein